jgi:hypothetical protein
MYTVKKILIALSIAVMVSVFVPPAKANGMDSGNWPTQVTFDRPVQIGNLVLDPGTYDFQLTDGTQARDVVQIYSVDRGDWVGMVMGINVNRQNTSTMTGFTFRKLGKNLPEQLEYWFYPQWIRGVKFIYPHNKVSRTMLAETHVPFVN